MKSESIPFRVIGLLLGAMFIFGAIIISASNSRDISTMGIISMAAIGFYFTFFGLTGFSSVVGYLNRNNEKK